MHAAVNGLRLPVKLVLTPGQAGDVTPAETLIAGVPFDLAIAGPNYPARRPVPLAGMPYQSHVKPGLCPHAESAPKTVVFDEIAAAGLACRHQRGQPTGRPHHGPGWLRPGVCPTSCKSSSVGGAQRPPRASDTMSCDPGANYL